MSLQLQHVYIVINMKKQTTEQRVQSIHALMYQEHSHVNFREKPKSIRRMRELCLNTWLKLSYIVAHFPGNGVFCVCERVIISIQTLKKQFLKAQVYAMRHVRIKLLVEPIDDSLKIDTAMGYTVYSVQY